MSFGIGPLEVGVILLVALLVFGPHRLPDFAQTVGRTLAEFRRTLSQLSVDLNDDALARPARRDRLAAQDRPPQSRPTPPDDPQ
ncbi:MAG: twin-arginine translocase TatA/TatE family subunit [Chloroflexi bacterium]|nr:twin-arginine translocase TatA/TatE family subunit [Chloroflexota bacterium]